jgi:gas vesicle protein GvpL/GvpF
VNEYLYAILERLPAAWRPSAAGVDGGPIAARRVGDLVVIGSVIGDVPPGNPRTLARHHDVVASTLDADAVLPFRYGVALPTAELESWVAIHRALINATLALVRGRVEMNVKLLRLDSAVDHQLARTRKSADGEGGAGDRELRGLGEHLVHRAGLPDWRYRPAGHAGNVVASVAFLVARAELPDFLARIAPVASRATGVAVVPTGPWPAYSFVPPFDLAPSSRVIDSRSDVRVAPERRAG